MIDKSQIEQILNTTIFGKYLYVFSEVESTNFTAMEFAREGAPEGTVVIAGHQTAGKGRMGRKWEDESGKNILMSLVLRPQLDIESVQRITLACADILIHSFEQFLINRGIKPLDFSVKWPNDILVNGKKIAGILTESRLAEKHIEFIVVGIGINVNQKIENLSKDIQHSATSFLAETGNSFPLQNLIVQILSDFEQNYFRLERTNYDSVIEDWKSHCNQFGNSIIIETAFGEENGLFHDINERGILLYKTDGGEIKELVAGTIK